MKRINEIVKHWGSDFPSTREFYIFYVKVEGNVARNRKYFRVHVEYVSPTIAQGWRSLCNVIRRISARFSQAINPQYLPRDYLTFLHAARRKVDRVWRQGSRRSDPRRSRERHFASALPAHHERKIRQCRNCTGICRLGKSAKTLDTDLRMSIVLSRDVLRWPTASFAKCMSIETERSIINVWKINDTTNCDLNLIKHLITYTLRNDLLFSINRCVKKKRINWYWTWY